MKCTSILLPLLCCFSGSIVANSPPATQQTDQIIIKYNVSSVAQMKNHRLITDSHGLIDSVKPMAGGAYIVHLNSKSSHFSRSSLSTVLTELKKDARIKYAVKDKIGYFKPLKDPFSIAAPLALSHAWQWDEFTIPAGINVESSAGAADGGWLYSAGDASPPVVVAVLDTGIERNPRLLSSLLYKADNSVVGWNVAANNNRLNDETGSYHGTHVSGTIAAHSSDLLGVGPLLKILPIKIPDSTGMFYESSVINGLYWAMGASVPGAPTNPYPAKVINMSFGIDEGPGREAETCSVATQDAVDFVRSKGGVLVVAAGNNNKRDDLGSPAGCKGTLRVTSTGPEGLRAYYSNYGPGTSFAAPGGDKRYGQAGGILSTVKPGRGINGSGLSFMQGTSMASPHVAGLAGLIFAAGQSQAIAAPTVESILYATTHDFAKSMDDEKNCVGKKACGHGIIDAKQALAATVANYHTLFSAPPLSAIRFVNADCAKGLVKANTLSLQTTVGDWYLTHNRCINLKAVMPRLTLVKKNIVRAQYGLIEYHLKHTFSQCHQIGFDGLGCYR